MLNRSEFLYRWLALALILLPISVAGIIFQPLSIEELTNQADLVVQGAVRSKTCQRDPSGRIYTKIELEIGELWKGAATTNPLLIVQGGGVLGTERLAVSGQVQYEVGEEVVAFLVRNERGEAVTIGLMQGKFHVWKDATTGVKLAASPFHGAGQSASGTAPWTPAARSIKEGAPLTLNGLKDRVREVGR